MVQTKIGASHSEWLQFIKDCSVLYRKRKQEAQEALLESQTESPKTREIPPPLPIPSKRKYTKRKTADISATIATEESVKP